MNGEAPVARAQLERHLQDVIPGFKNFLLPRTGDVKQLRAAFASPAGEEYSLEFGELSEGQRALSVLYAAVSALAGKASVLCFDEPDNFLSLPEIQPWLHTLRDTIDERGGQAMVISHHPEIIDYLSLDSVWRFERPGGLTVPREIARDHPDRSSELTLSQVIARGG
jgi:ATPase subunit of ABC transporter with duplicated ATPase domains